MKENRIKTLLSKGLSIFGTTVQTASPEAVEMVGHAGFDYVMIDMEHGTLDLSMVVQMLRAAEVVGLATAVRVPDHTPSLIMRVLDAGASTILAPHVSTAAQAEALAQSIKYGPRGRRGACPYTRATGHFTEDWPQFSSRSNRETLLWGIIEDVEGVDNIDAIVESGALDAVFPGPFDLSQALGYEGDVTHSEVQALVHRVTSCADRANVNVMMILSWTNNAAAPSNPRIFLEGVDRVMLSQALRNTRQELRAQFGR